MPIIRNNSFQATARKTSGFLWGRCSRRDLIAPIETSMLEWRVVASERGLLLLLRQAPSTRVGLEGLRRYFFGVIR